MTPIELRILAIAGIIALAVVLVVLARLAHWLADAARAGRLRERDRRPRPVPESGITSSHAMLTRHEFWRLRC